MRKTIGGRTARSRKPLGAGFPPSVPLEFPETRAFEDCCSNPRCWVMLWLRRMHVSTCHRQILFSSSFTLTRTLAPRQRWQQLTKTLALTLTSTLNR